MDGSDSTGSSVRSAECTHEHTDDVEVFSSPSMDNDNLDNRVSFYEDVESGTYDTSPPAANESKKTDGLNKDSQLENITLLWEEYVRERSERTREQLILHYAPLVKYIAGRLSSALPKHIDVEDLNSYGLFGLINAVDSYNPENGNKFETYASFRIKGSMLDELRKADWLPRSMREKIKAIDKYSHDFQTLYETKPTEGEIAEAVGLPERSVRTAQKVKSQAYLLSLNFDGNTESEKEHHPFNVNLQSVRNTEVETFTANDNSIESFLNSEEVKDIIKSLPHEDKIIVLLTYYEGLTFKQVGEVLNIHEDACRRRHAKLLKSLKYKHK